MTGFWAHFVAICTEAHFDCITWPFILNVLMLQIQLCPLPLRGTIITKVTNGANLLLEATKYIEEIYLSGQHMRPEQPEPFHEDLAGSVPSMPDLRDF